MAIDYVRGVFSRHTPEANRVNSLKLCPLAILIPLEENPYTVHWVQKVSAHLGDQVLDFKLRSFVDPKPVEL